MSGTVGTTGIPKLAGGLTPLGMRVPASRGGLWLFADAAFRATVAPYFVGQVGVQLDEHSVWIGSGLAPGDWLPVTLPTLLVANFLAATTLGTVIGQMEVFDAAGVSVGFVPVYDAIT
jgi:hypothetical protein